MARDHWALRGIGLGRSECTPAGMPAGAPCSSPPIARLIERFGSAARMSGGGAVGLPRAVRRAAAALRCESESCVLSAPAFIAYAASNGVAPAALEAEKARRFKAAGPRDSTALLSNINIDETLQRWAVEFPEFFAYPYAMIDFDQTGDSLGAHEVVDVLDGKAAQTLPDGRRVLRPATCVGCVLNTDVSTGPGKHWVAVFVDTRGPGAWTVEYFNSAGRPPPRQVTEWMERTRRALDERRGAAPPADSVPVTTVVHQRSRTECGPYACYYIRRRLEGTPYRFFESQPIPDEAMIEFRKLLFRAHE